MFSFQIEERLIMHHDSGCALSANAGDIFEYHGEFFKVRAQENGEDICDGCFFDGIDIPCPPVLCPRLVFKEIKIKED